MTNPTDRTEYLTPTDPNRCAVCGWPLRPPTFGMAGCVGHRPAPPSSLVRSYDFDPDRAERERIKYEKEHR